jgi:hypothetical protein
MSKPEARSPEPSAATSPEPDRLRRDAAWVASLYPVKHRPVAAPWHPTCIHVPASVRGLVEGMAGYGD